MTTASSRQVLVVQRRLTHYRVPFFEMLRADLRSAGVSLRLAHGDPTPEEATKRDSGVLDWAERLPTRYFLGGRLCWQPFSHVAAGVDMTVITAENKLICNLGEQFLARQRRVALWGHGANLQGEAGSLRERFKARVALRADWWLAYTEMSRDLVKALGFPQERITVLNNAVDTTELAAQFAAVPPQARAALRAELGLGDGPVGLYLGSLYEEKRIGFLLEAAQAIRQRLPGFALVVVGGGPQQDMIQSAAAAAPWIKAMGIRKGADKALVASLADVMLNPGLVGLNILDSFAGGLPMLTTDCGLHSPEISYLSSGRNGVMTANTLEDYVEGSVALLTDSRRLQAMRDACLADAGRYTLAEMSARFTQGVLGALAAPIRRGRP
ncbi:glycosyltransferase family 4 protein [Roseateles saccharophilus]|uniref:Glycosyl transferase family 1 n=1 Tax=Roseateles saccharophilus TaxID=304 RepID=A0A4V2VQ39_ROSSA|nr:glycosyltransferase family 4 protein [Roseateles saccharophilus]MDG0833424.1 glycosyltransferase [Roseateles saccharophilus]TCU93079.1 glycosyl transferase family 1 [Roseateles saccharophilus]